MTADSLHVGHLMPILLLKKFWQAGNRVIILLGGGTTKIGDPSDKNEMRKMLSDEEIAHNKKGILYCIGKVFGVDFSTQKEAHWVDNVMIVDNASWLLGLNYIDVLREIGTHFTVNKMVAIDFVKRRLENEIPLTFLEFNYMLIQGYDFYHLNREYGCNVQTGGSEQWGNIIQGCELIRRKQIIPNRFGATKSILNCDPVFGLTMPLLTKADGTKMGKTAGGAVWLDEKKLSPFEFFQYFRNVDDKDIVKFFKTFTEFSLEEIDKFDLSKPNELKEMLAFEVTKLCHGETEAKQAMESARNLFSSKIDENVVFDFSSEEDRRLVNLIVKVGFAKSNGEARRLVKGGGVKIDDEKILDENFIIKNGIKFILSCGKRNRIGVNS